VIKWGTWRVNGQLAVSRAIGDGEYKPLVTAQPDVTTIVMNGTEDFIIGGLAWLCMTFVSSGVRRSLGHRHLGGGDRDRVPASQGKSGHYQAFNLT
jgi:hypothetical protein